MKKIIDNREYSCVLFLLITPILVMLLNFFNLNDLTKIAWYLPNLLLLPFGLFFLIKSFKEKNNYLFLILVIIAFLACLFSNNKKAAFYGDPYRLEGFITYIGYLGFFYLGTKLKDINKNKKLINLFLIGSTTIAFLSLIKSSFTYRFFCMDIDSSYFFHNGPFYAFNHYGVYLLIANVCCVCLFLFNKGKIKLLYLFMHILLLYTLVMNDTFGVYLAFLFTLICLLVYFIVKKSNIKDMIILFVVFIFISCISYKFDYKIHIVYRNFSELFHDTSTIVTTDNIENIYNVGTSRGELWIFSVKFILKKPILGYGYDYYNNLYIRDKIKLGGPHNLIFEQALCIGIFGMILFFIIILSIVWKKLKDIKHIDYVHFIAFFVVIAYLASSMFANSTFYLAPYFYLFLGILYTNNIRKDIIK